MSDFTFPLNLGNESPGASGANGAGYLATSTTSHTVADSGDQAFTVATGLAYSPGARVRLTSRGTGEYEEGVVKTYVTTTLTIAMDKKSGTGTHTDWNLNLAGEPGLFQGSGTAGQLALWTDTTVLGGDAGLTFANAQLLAPKLAIPGTFDFSPNYFSIFRDDNLGSHGAFIIQAEPNQLNDATTLYVRTLDGNGVPNSLIFLDGVIGLVEMSPDSANTGFDLVSGQLLLFNGTAIGSYVGNTSNIGSSDTPMATGYFGTSLVTPKVALTDSSAPVDATASSVVLDSLAPNADLTLTAKTKGNLAPPVTITLHNTGGTNVESIVTTGLDIVVTLATTLGTITSTANSVKATIDGDTGGAADLVTVAVQGSGLGLVDAFETPQPTAGGVDGTVGTKNDIIAANGAAYLCTADTGTANDGVTDGSWMKFTLEAA